MGRNRRWDVLYDLPLSLGSNFCSDTCNREAAHRLGVAGSTAAIRPDIRDNHRDLCIPVRFFGKAVYATGLAQAVLRFCEGPTWRLQSKFGQSALRGSGRFHLAQMRHHSLLLISGCSFATFSSIQKRLPFPPRVPPQLARRFAPLPAGPPQYQCRCFMRTSPPLKNVKHLRVQRVRHPSPLSCTTILTRSSTLCVIC